MMPPVPAWSKSPYPVAPDPLELALPRALFPPNAIDAGQTPSTHGPDLLAYKRAISRAGRWPWNPPGWDDAYSNAFAHGASVKAVDTSGVAGLQRQSGLEPSGWLDEETFEVLRISLVPTAKGIAHGGEPLFDSVCLRLLALAAKQFVPPAPGEDQIRAAIAEFLEKAEANEPRWHYSQNRPVTVDVDPAAASVNADCSGIAILAYRYAMKKTGLDVADPAKQRFSGFGNTDLFEDDHPQITDGHYRGRRPRPLQGPRLHLSEGRGRVDIHLDIARTGIRPRAQDSSLPLGLQVCRAASRSSPEQAGRVDLPTIEVLDWGVVAASPRRRGKRGCRVPH